MYNTETRWKILWLDIGLTHSKKESNTLSGSVISVVWLFTSIVFVLKSAESSGNLQKRSKTVSDRTIRGKAFNWLDVNKGTCQGSVSGPYLFNLFINDLCINNS